MFDDTDNFIKDNLQNILDGNFDDKFKPEQLKIMLELSFLYNHISIENDSIIFKYNGIELKINGMSEIDELASQKFEKTDQIITAFIQNKLPNVWICASNRVTQIGPKEEITSMIKDTDIFKSALKQFLRDKKINEILE